MNQAVSTPLHDDTDGLAYLLANQKKAFLANPMPEAKQRIRNLDKLHNALLDHKEQLLKAVSQDFSNRSEAETLLAEFYATMDGLAYNRKRLKKWMKPQRRHVPLTVMPASVKVVYQPLGVVGIVVPWNFPIFLGLSPLIGALAAGNRAMIKTSEFAPATSQVVKSLLASAFDESEVAVVEGGVETSIAFTNLPFDHLVFTGATEVGKQVMAAAAKNLTPVTLELGGKSPAIIHEDFPIKEAASRIAFGKGINCGQVCVSPDYIMVPNGKVDEFAREIADVLAQRYPTIKDNQDYTAIINDRQHVRLQSYLDDAKAKGATLHTINPANESLEGTRKMPFTVVTNVTEDMLVMQEELFGPIIPVLSYNSIDEAVNYVNSKSRPLALYYFDWNTQRSDDILGRTHSGGVCLNDTMSHVMADDIPFGGIGASGIGHYHGHEGFLNFSKAKGVVRKGKLDVAAFVAPPWDNTMFKMLGKMMDFRFRRRSIK
ncbi:coniferyl aldehyde dehydrogenase [Bacterioplanoides sp.]|uniref:coniferyl aldehyde dehydrogenase n=1 Tax=Bacterioplanoides sp. TaxID=2066072 RepID=UPI003B004A2E